MCQTNYNTETKKYKHLNFIERTQIERWYNKDKKTIKEIAELLDKSERTIRREIKRGYVKNLTSNLEEKRRELKFTMLIRIVQEKEGVTKIIID